MKRSPLPNPGNLSNEDEENFLNLIFVIIHSNCITFFDYTSEWGNSVLPEKSSQQKTFLIDYAKRGLYRDPNGPPKVSDLKSNETLRQEYELAFGKSEYIRPVESVLWDADLKIGVEESVLVKYSRVNLFLSAFTIFIVPFWEAQDCNVVFSFRDKDNALLGRYSRHYTKTQWGHLAFALVLPFKGPKDFQRDINRQLATSVLQEAYQAGILGIY